MIRISVICLGAAFCIGPVAAMAEGITIEYATTKLVADAYRLDAKIKFDFNEEVVVALEHGVELHIDVLMRIKRERRWLWDPVIEEDSLNYTLQHHALSEDYVVTDLNRDIRHQFPSYEAALKYIGNISNHLLVDRDLIRNDSGYSGYIRARLNIETLPAPLQPIAYVSEKWRMQSPWYEWVVR